MAIFKAHTSDTLQRAMENNAAAVVIAHNHPSGVGEPPHADRSITDRIRQALNLVDVRVPDHIVIGVEGTTSFAERGLL